MTFLLQDGDWDDYMQLLCLSLELAICNTLKSSSETSALESRYSDYDPSTLRHLKLKLENSNWSVVAAIFQVLRNIQKYLKKDFDDKIMKAYLDSVSSLILNLPWDLLREIYAGHNTKELQGSAEDQPRELAMFFGNFIRFLCSLVNQSSSLEDGLGFSPLFCRIINLVPKLIAWCHADTQSSYHVRISHYFRHKVLVNNPLLMFCNIFCKGIQILMINLFMSKEITLYNLISVSAYALIHAKLKW